MPDEQIEPESGRVAKSAAAPDLDDGSLMTLEELRTQEAIIERGLARLKACGYSFQDDQGGM